VTLTLTDDDTGGANGTTSLTVHNEVPLVDAGVDVSVAVSTTVAFNGSFTDVGTLDTHTIDWDFGDGVTASGTLTPSHTFTAEGVYTVTLTVTDDDTGVASDSLIVTVTDSSTQVYVYLPIVMVGSSTPPGPDLVVSSLTASGSDITVVVTNQGDTAVTDAFWVDVYSDPDPIPTMVNQTWAMLADQGLVWGVDNVTLNPGQSLTLTIDGAHYQANLSNFSGNLLPGTPVYAQVDSANTTTTYGAVLENHEDSGGVYNNITGTTAQ
jgi:PKD repeat protein